MKKFICPVCGCRTLKGRGENEICQVCYWQDDGLYDEDIENGCNNGLTIIQAKQNFVRCGAFDEQFVRSTRKPQSSEITEYYTNLINTNGGI